MTGTDQDRYDIVVVGAGAAGAMAARTALAAGRSVCVIEAASRPGGRLQNTRVVAMCGGDLSFDHGAQFMSFRDPELAALGVEAEPQGALVPLGTTGCVKAGVWRPLETGPRFRGRPDMASFIVWLLRACPVRLDEAVQSIARDGEGFSVETTRGVVRAKQIVLAVPPTALGALGMGAPNAAFDPCWAVSVGFNQPVARLPFEAFEVRNAPLGWAMRQPAWRDGERFGRDRWVLHFTADWSRDHAGASDDKIADAALSAFSESLCEALPPVGFTYAHWWAQARVREPLGELYWRIEPGLVAAGDWCIGGRVEAAMQSGRAAGQSLVV